jgi:hypothetical protein
MISSRLDIDINNLKKSFKSSKYNFSTKKYDTLYLNDYLSQNRFLNIQTTNYEYMSPYTDFSGYMYYNENQVIEPPFEGGKVQIYSNTGNLDYTKYFIVNNYKKQIEKLEPKLMKNVVDEFEFRFGNYIEVDDISASSVNSNQPKKPTKKKIFKSDIGFVKFGKILKYMNERTKKLPNQYNFFKLDIEETLSISLNHKQLKKEEKQLQTFRIILNQEHIYHYYINNFIKYYIEKDNVNSLKLCKKFKTEYTNTFESTNYDIRFSHNIEETYDLHNLHQQDKQIIHYLNIFDEREKKFRFRKRYKFTKYEKNIGIYCLDLTIVKTNKYPAKALNEIKEQDYQIEYEMELELLYPDDKLLIDFQPNYYLFNVYEILSELVLYRVLIDDNGFFLSNYDKKHLKYLYKDLSKSKYYDFLGPKPEGFDIHKAKNIDNSFSIAIKADGERHLLMILPNSIENYGRHIYLINNRLEVIPTGLMISDDIGFCIFDGEYMLNEKKFYIFDVLFYNNKDVRDYHFYNNEKSQNELRYFIIESFKNNYLQSNKIINSNKLYNYYLENKKIQFEILPQFTIEVKKTYVPQLEGKSIIELYEYLNKEEKFKSISNDGFILTQMEQPYPKDTRKAWMNTYKLKPKSQNTIDFMVNKFTKININGIDFMKIQLNCSRLISQNNYEFTPFIVDSSLYYKYNYEQICYMYVPLIGNQIFTSDNIEIFEKSIIECKWEDFKSKTTQNPYLNNWYPLRMRLDKIELYFNSNTIRGTANNINIARNIWKELNEPDIQFDKLLKGYFGVKMDEKKTKEFDSVRKLHRNIKKQLIQQFILKETPDNTKLIDFTCGRGSDMKNWLDIKIKNVIGYDIDYNSIYTYDKDGIYWRFFNHFNTNIADIQNYNYFFMNTNSAKESLYTLLFGTNINKTTNSIIGNFNNKSYIHSIFYNNIIKQYNKQIYYHYKSNIKLEWNEDNKLEFNNFNINLYLPLLKDILKQFGYEVDSKGYLYIRNNNKFNIATNFFSVHYFFNNKNDILQLMNNVSQILYINENYDKCGKWLITCMNGSKLIEKFGYYINDYKLREQYDIRYIDENKLQIKIKFADDKYRIDLNNVFKTIQFKSQNYTYTEINRLFDDNFLLKYLSLQHLQNICLEYIHKGKCKKLLYDMYQIKMYEIGLKLFDRKVNEILQIQITNDKLVSGFKSKFKQDFIKISKNSYLYNLGIFILSTLYNQKVFDFIRNDIEMNYNELIKLYKKNYRKYNLFTKSKNNIVNDISNNDLIIDIDLDTKISSELDTDINNYVLCNNTLLDYINDIIIGDKVSVKVSSISNFAKNEPFVFDFGLNLYTKSFGLMSQNNNQQYKKLENMLNQPIKLENINLDNFKEFMNDISFKDTSSPLLNKFHTYFYQTLYSCIVSDNKEKFIKLFIDIISGNQEIKVVLDDNLQLKYIELLFNSLIEIYNKFNISNNIIYNLNNLSKDIDNDIPVEYINMYCKYIDDKDLGNIFTGVKDLYSELNGPIHGLKEFSELHNTYTFGKCNVEEFINDRIYYTNYISQFISQSIDNFGYNKEYIIIK